MREGLFFLHNRPSHVRVRMHVRWSVLQNSGTHCDTHCNIRCNTHCNEQDHLTNSTLWHTAVTHWTISRTWHCDTFSHALMKRFFLGQVTSSCKEFFCMWKGLFCKTDLLTCRWIRRCGSLVWRTRECARALTRTHLLLYTMWRASKCLATLQSWAIHLFVYIYTHTNMRAHTHTHTHTNTHTHTQTHTHTRTHTTTHTHTNTHTSV